MMEATLQPLLPSQNPEIPQHSGPFPQKALASASSAEGGCPAGTSLLLSSTRENGTQAAHCIIQFLVVAHPLVLCWLLGVLNNRVLHT